MVVTRLAIAVVLVACSPNSRELHALVGDDPGYACTCHDGGAALVADAMDTAVDAAVDVPPDASPDAPIDAAPPLHIDLTAPWMRTVVTPGSPTGVLRGADGTSPDAQGCIVTAWEQGGITTRACLVAGAWATELVASGITGPEDAKAGDLDGDGVIDVVACADAGQRCYITFRGSPNVTTALTASMGHGYAMQSAIGDVNGDGLPDVIFGTRGGSPAVVAWLENPGALARTGAAWSYHQISEAGWTMSVVALDVDHDGDMDLVVSDRTRNGTSWALYGARWEEQTPTGWINHPISAPAGSCPVGQPMCTNKNPGDEMFLTVTGDAVYDCSSLASSPDSRVMIHRTTDWLTWTHEVLAPVANVGHCQGIEVADVDGDGLLDLIVTAWKGNSYPVPPSATGESGVYWLRNLGGGAYARGEISGSTGGKFDNGLWRNGQLVTSEQLDPNGGLGVVVYEPVMVP